MAQTTFGKVSGAISKFVAATSAIAAAAGVAFVGLTMLLAGVIVAQQAMARGLGVGVRLGDAFGWAARGFDALAGVLGRAPRTA